MKQADVVAGKYQLISLLGQGGMGSVWRAQHLGLNAPVAIKLIDPSLAGSGEGLARFHREAQAAAALRSPHVVQVLDHGVDPVSGQPFIVMEMMEGESLATRLGKIKRLTPAVEAINALAGECERLSDAELKARAQQLRAEVQERLGQADPSEPDYKQRLADALEPALAQAFALTREAGRRTLPVIRPGAAGGPAEASRGEDRRCGPLLFPGSAGRRCWPSVTSPSRTLAPARCRCRWSSPGSTTPTCATGWGMAWGFPPSCPAWKCRAPCARSAAG